MGWFIAFILMLICLYLWSELDRWKDWYYSLYNLQQRPKKKEEKLPLARTYEEKIPDSVTGR